MTKALAIFAAAAFSLFALGAQAAETVLVFGGNRATGLEAVKQLVTDKASVTVFVRASSDTTELKALGVKLVTGDVLQAADVQKAFASGKYTAVVSALGAVRGQANPDFEGLKNITDAAKAAGVKRIVVVTAIGAGDSNSMTPESLKKVLQPILIEKGKGEEYLAASGLDYTIIRPGGLKNGAPTGKATLTEDRTKHSDINRSDLGVLVAKSVGDKKTYRKILHAIDPTLPSAVMP
jgi:nucleoside-diphosphate-sugar epimerase